MFHAGTPDSTKSLILKDILQHDGIIRILICTIAFGMGVTTLVIQLFLPRQIIAEDFR